MREEWLAELLIWEEDTDLVLTSSRKEFGFFPNKFVNRLIDAWWQKVLLLHQSCLMLHIGRVEASKG